MGESEPEIAYAAARKAADRKAPDGRDLPEWDALPPKFQAAVSAGIRAVDAARAEPSTPHDLPTGRVYREDDKP